MAELTREDALAQYRHFYTPNNAILVIAGDVTEEEVRRQAEATFGHVPRRSEPGPRKRAMEPPPLAERTVTLRDSRVSQPSLSRTYLVPSYPNAPPGEAEALDVLADVLGRGPTSRLYRSLIVEKAIASSASSYYSGDGQDYGKFGFFVAPRGNASLETLTAAVDDAIQQIRDHGITQDELDRAKRRTRASAIYAQDSQATLARIVGTVMINGQTLADVQTWPSRIDKVTLADVSLVARKYLDKRRSVTGSLLPTPAESRS
jgi:zinc protease